MERLNPLNDFIFQKLFGEKGRETELLSLLNAILYIGKEEKLTSVEILEDKTMTAEVIGDKTGILDVRGVTNKGSHINIEVQRKDYGNMHIRSPFYWSLLFSRGIKKGDDHILLPKVIAINILDYEYCDLPLFHTSYHLSEDTYKNHILTDAMEFHYVEMPKFRRIEAKDLNNPLHRWLLFFEKELSEERLKELEKMDTAIRNANNILEYLSADEATVREYQRREMALFDQRWIAQSAKKENSIEIAKSLLAIAVLSIEDIARSTKLTVEEVQNLKETIETVKA